MHVRAQAWTACLVSGLAILTSGCGDGDPDAAATRAMGGTFCADAQARVEAFMARAEAGSPVPDDPRYGGRAVVGGIADLRGGMNAFALQHVASNQHQMFVNQMTLIRYGDDLLPAPWLAESWQVSDDGGSLTFRLRDDVFWHDGERTDAYDVAFTYLRASDPASGFPNAAYWDFYVGGAEGVEVVDSLTVTLHMTPHADFMDPWRSVAIMPEHLLGDVPPAELGQHPYGTCPVGNGPFVFVSYRPQESWTFRANPAFSPSLGGRPFLDRYVYRVVPEQSTLLNELRSGGVDLYFLLLPDQIGAIEADPALELHVGRSREVVFVAWNARRPQLADARVRRALTRGLDRASIVDALLGGHGVVASASVPPFHFAHDPSAGAAVSYDREAARALLDEAGWIDRDGDGVRENADGLPLSISLKTNAGNRLRQDIAEIMQAQLRSIGVDVRPELVEMGTLMGQITDPDSRDFDSFILSWAHEFKVDDADLFHSARVDAPYQWSGIRSPTLDRYLDTLQLVLDRDQARPLWREYQRALIQEQPYTFLYYPAHLNGVRNTLRNVEMDERGSWVNVREWWVEPS
jgi:peptide/nickel transport system substrate-binding protein